VAESTPGNRALRTFGLVAIGGIPSLVIVVVLGAIGIAFTVSGLVLFVAGQLGIEGGLPWWVGLDADPRLAVLVGVVLSVTGLTSLFGLFLYLHLAARVVRKVLPARPA
jgi:hypothetical protein